jgi:hypothetical protein
MNLNLVVASISARVFSDISLTGNSPKRARPVQFCGMDYGLPAWLVYVLAHLSVRVRKK